MCCASCVSHHTALPCKGEPEGLGCGGGAANVLLKATSADRRGYLCKLGDFGLARLLDPSQHTHVSTQTYGALKPRMRTRIMSPSTFAKLGS